MRDGLPHAATQGFDALEQLTSCLCRRQVAQCGLGQPIGREFQIEGAQSQPSPVRFGQGTAYADKVELIFGNQDRVVQPADLAAQPAATARSQGLRGDGRSDLGQ